MTPDPMLGILLLLPWTQHPRIKGEKAREPWLMKGTWLASRVAGVGDVGPDVTEPKSLAVPAAAPWGAAGARDAWHFEILTQRQGTLTDEGRKSGRT